MIFVVVLLKSLRGRVWNRLLPISPKPISPKPISPKIVFRSFRPFLVGVRLWRPRRVFAPNQDIFRTVEKYQKFQTEVELLQYLYKMFSKITGIYIFNYDFRPFTVGVRLQRHIHGFAPHSDKTFSEPLKKLKNSNWKRSDCRICIRCIRKFSIFSSLTSILDLLSLVSEEGFAPV